MGKKRKKEAATKEMLKKEASTNEKAEGENRKKKKTMYRLVQVSTST